MIKINLAKSILRNGDCLDVLKELPDNSIDSIVTDPPYGISFMGKKWDYDVPKKEVFAEMLRVLKPGGYMLCACGTRTQHRMAVNIEDAGFEIRDVITWLYGSGFPKSMDISKAIDKQNGTLKLEATGETCPDMRGGNFENSQGKERLEIMKAVPHSEEAKQWQGWGTALKPACEFWTLARKPLSEKTVASNVLKHGTGGINIDGCRIEGSFEPGWSKSGSKESENTSMSGKNYDRPPKLDNPQGRWPANLILDEEAAKVLDEQSGILKSGASRFFYVAKASKSERNAVLEGFPKIKSGVGDERPSGQSMQRLDGREPREMQNIHPTVKPVKLMAYLCKMITPLNGIILDPFMGSGSTGVAAVKEGFGFIGIERDEKYFEICQQRIGV